MLLYLIEKVLLGLFRWLAASPPPRFAMLGGIWGVLFLGRGSYLCFLLIWGSGFAASPPILAFRRSSDSVTVLVLPLLSLSCGEAGCFWFFFLGEGSAASQHRLCLRICVCFRWVVFVFLAGAPWPLIFVSSHVVFVCGGRGSVCGCVFVACGVRRTAAALRGDTSSGSPSGPQA